MNIYTQKITPEIAKDMLSKNTMNRTPSKNVIKQYAKDMREGRWFSDTPNTIVFSNTDKLIDGQKRLMAIILSNEPQIMNIVKGMSEEAFKYIDRGQARSIKNDLQALKMKYADLIPAVINKYLLLRKRTIADSSRKEFNDSSDASTSKVEKRNLILELHEANTELLEEICKTADRIYYKAEKIINKSDIAAYILYAYDFGSRYGELMADLFEKVADGEYLSKGMPEYYLNRFFFKENGSQKPIKAYHNTMVKCFLAYYRGGEIHRIHHLPSDEFIYLQDHLKQLSIAS